MEITLYTTDCPRCRDLKTLLDRKHINYSIVTSVEEMIKLGLTHAPALKIGDELMNSEQAFGWIKNH